jgi:hypothetical protein
MCNFASLDALPILFTVLVIPSTVSTVLYIVPYINVLHAAILLGCRQLLLHANFTYSLSQLDH